MDRILKNLIKAMILVWVLLMPFSVCAFAEEITIDGFKGTVNGSEFIVSKYTGTDSVVRVPAKLNGYDTVLSGAVFQNKANVTEVSFDQGVKLRGSAKNMFSSCEKLQTVDMSEVDTSEVTDMFGMFSGCSALTSLDLSGFDTSSVTSMGGMFKLCSSLTTLDLSGLDTSSVTNMSYMYSGCSSLTTLDLSGFNTGNVTDMSGMFNCCISLTDLDVSGFDTSKVVSMGGTNGYTYDDDHVGMFSYCSSLTSLDLSGFDTSNATDMSGMFYKCSSLTVLDLENFNTSKVTNMSGMFRGCRSLTSLDLSGFDTSKVTDMSYMFGKGVGPREDDDGCSSLTTLNISNFDTSKVTDMGHMFERCRGLTSLDLSGFNTSNVTNMNSMFSGCNGLTSLDLSGFDTSKVTNMGGMFGKNEIYYGAYYDYSLSGCRELVSLDISSFDTSSVTNMYGMFYGCSSLTSLNVSGFDTSNVTDMSGMFSKCSSLTTLDVSNFNTSNVIDMGPMFSDYYGMFSYCSSLTSLNLSDFDTSKVIDMSCMFYECSGLTTLDVSGFDTGKVTNMGSMFRLCSSLTSLDVTGFDTSNVTSMGSMFSECSSLTTLDVTGFDTSNVTSMGSMFSECSSLTTLDVSGFDTSNVTAMSRMFYGCSSLASPDVSGFDTSNVTAMSRMFSGCSSLTNLNVSGFDTSNVEELYSMFYGCRNLTTLDVSGFDTSKVTDRPLNMNGMSDMFYGCSSLTTLDVSNFDASNITNISRMFSGCSSLTNLNVSGFDTSNVTSMYSMFSGCSSLTTLDVSGLDTSNVTSMGSMFSGCSSLIALDVSGFDTSKVTNMQDMFSGCYGLCKIETPQINNSDIICMLPGDMYELKNGIVQTVKYSDLMKAPESSVLVVAGYPIITSPDASEITYGETLAKSVLSGGSACTEGEFLWNDPSIAPSVSDSNKTEFEVKFVPRDTVNYPTSICKVKLVVKKAQIRVSAVPNRKKYGEEDPVLSYDVTGLINGDEMTGRLVRDEGENVGTYEIGQGTLSIGANYEIISFIPALFTIEKTNASVIDPLANELTYNGKMQELVSSGVSEHGSFLYSIDGINFDQSVPMGKNAGKYTVYYKFTGDKNHNSIDTEQIVITILKKSLRVTAERKEKVYGQPDPQLTYVSEGLVEGDYISGDLMREDGEDVGSYEITCDGLSAGENYILNWSGALFEIKKAPSMITVQPIANSIKYDGRRHELISAGEAEGGTVCYACTGNSEKPPIAETFSEQIPSEESPGSYSIWYMVKGDKNHLDTVPICVIARIIDSNITPPDDDEEEKPEKELPEETPDTNLKDLAVEAQKKGFGAWDDTIVLSQSGKEFFLETTRQEELLTVVRGNKFTILGGEKGSFVSDNKKFVSVSKKGVVKAKRHFGKRAGVCISYSDAVSGQTVNIRVRVWEQVLFNTRVTRDDTLLYNVGSQKLKMKTEINRSFDFSSLILLNSDLAEPVNPGVIDNLRMEIGDDGRYHVRGNTIKRGTVKFPYRIYGKKFTVVIRVK